MSNKEASKMEYIVQAYHEWEGWGDVEAFDDPDKANAEYDRVKKLPSSEGLRLIIVLRED